MSNKHHTFTGTTYCTLLYENHLICIKSTQPIQEPPHQYTHHPTLHEQPVSTHLLEDGDGAPPTNEGVQHLVLQDVPQLEGALLAAQNHFVQVGAGMDKSTDVEGGITELHFQVHSC